MNDLEQFTRTMSINAMYSAKMSKDKEKKNSSQK